MRVFHKHGVVLLLLLLVLFVSGVSVECVNAAETDTTWQNDYEYSLDAENRIITLNKYIGSNTDIVVPGKAVIGGVEYQTALKAVTRINNGFYSNTCIWYNDVDDGENITSLVFEEGIKLPSDCGYMFYGLWCAKPIDVSKLNTSNVTKMDGMFKYCRNLTSIDLSNFDTSNVTTMAEMFDGCDKLETLNVSNFDTSNVTDMNCMFYSCLALKNLNLCSFNTSKVTDMDGMFYYCDNLCFLLTPINNKKSITLPVGFHEFNKETQTMGSEVITVLDSNQLKSRVLTSRNIENGWDISKAQDESVQAFLFDDGLLYITGSGEMIDWAASVACSETAECVSTNNNNVKTKYYYNSGGGNSNYSITTIVPVKWVSVNIIPWSFLDIKDKVKTVYCEGSFSGSAACLFAGLGELTSVDFTGYSGYITDCSNLFIDCVKLEAINGLSTIDTSQVTRMSHMFSGCSGLTSLDVSNFNTSQVMSMSSMFENCSGLTSLDLSNFNTSKVTSMVGMFDGCSGLTSLDVSNFNTSKVTDMSSMFYGCSKLTSLDVSNFDTSKVTSMSSAFSGCSELTSLNLSNFDTSKVTSMRNMFSGCSSLVSLDSSNFDTNKVTDMRRMFEKCSSLKELNLSNFNTSNVTDMSWMFKGCSSLKELDLSNFNTANVTNMFLMFGYCSVLTSLDLRSFNTASVTDMGQMFNSCSGLTSLNISSFNTANVTDMDAMFSECSKLNSLDLSNFDTRNVTNMRSVFSYCSNIQTLNLKSFDTSNVTDMGYMFFRCDNLESLSISGFDTSNVTYMGCMLDYCTSLHYLKTPIKNTIEISLPATYYAFNKATNTISETGITTLAAGQTVSKDLVTHDHVWDGPLDTECNICGFQRSAQSSFEYGGVAYNLADAKYHWDISKSQDGSVKAFLFNDGLLYITGSGSMIEWQGSSAYVTDENNVSTYTGSITSDDLQVFTNIDLNNTKTYIPTQWRSTRIIPWAFNDIRPKITKAVFEGTISGTTSFMFCGCSCLEIIDFSRSSLSINNAPSMFHGCDKLYSMIDFKNITPTNDFYSTVNMFYGCSNLTEIDLTNWYTPNCVYMGYMFYNCSGLTSLNVSKFNTSKVTEMDRMFYGCSKLTNLNLSNLNTNNVTNMKSMFYNCFELTSLDLSSFNTSKVTDMSFMFYGCSKLTSLNLSNFNTGNVTTMNSMFYECSGLTSLDLSSFNTSSVTNMSFMFNKCSGLTSLILSSFDTGNVTVVNSMFQLCSELTSLNISNFDTSKVKNMSFMFNKCSKLTSLNLSNFNTSKVTNMKAMFQRCSELTSLDISNFDMTKVTITTSMFSSTSKLHCIKTPKNCSISTALSKAMRELKLATNSIGSDVYSNLPKAQSVSKVLVVGPHSCDENHVCKICGYRGYLFDYNSKRYCTADASYTWDISKDQNGSVNAYLFSDGLLYITGEGEMIDWQASAGFTNSSSIVSTKTTSITEKVYTPTKIGVSKSYTPTKWASEKMVPWSFYDIRNKIKTVYFKGNFSGSAACLFGNCDSLVKVDFNEYTGKINNFATLFIADDVLSEVAGIEKLDTSNITSTYYMFGVCPSLTSLNLSNFNTNNVTNMRAMFYNCSSLTSLDISNFNTSNVTDMAFMFYGCSGLTSLNVSKVNTSKVTTMYAMFYDCSGLTELGLSNFNTSNVTDMSFMFRGCSGLTDLDLSKFNTASVTNMRTMFYDCSSLKTLNVSNFNTSKVINMSYMFNNCSCLQALDLSKFDMSNVTDVTDMLTNCTSLHYLKTPIKNTLDITLPATYYEFNKAANSISETGIATLTIGQTVSKDLVTHAHVDEDSNFKCDICGYVIPRHFVVDGKDYYSNQSKLHWDISKAQDGSVMAYLFDDGLMYIAGAGEMIDWKYSAAYSDAEDNVSTNTNTIVHIIYPIKLPSPISVRYTPTEWRSRGMVPWGFVDIKDLIKVVYCDGNFSGDMSCMFAGLSKLTTLNLTKYTGKPTSFKQVLIGCTSLKTIDGLNAVDTSRVTTMDRMFTSCSGLTSLNMSDFNTSKVTTMCDMFYNCSSLTSLDLSNFDTSNVTDMYGMFAGCSNLISLDLSNVNTSNVNTMEGMFYNCSGLSSLDLSSFDMSKVTSADAMLAGTNSLATLSTPKNCALALELPYKMYDVDNVSYTSIPNLTTSIELTKDPKFDYKVSIPTNVVLMADVKDGDGIYSSTRFTAAPNIIVHGSAGNMKLAIKSHDVNDNAGEMTLRGGDNTMPCKMKFTDTDSCIFDLYTDRLTAEQKQDASGDGLLIPLELLATGLDTTGRYEGSLEFEFSRIP